MDELERLRRQAAGLQELMRELGDAAPERAEGTDRTGAVRVVIGSAGLPESIQVDAWWRDRLRPEALGSAVTDAWRQAMRRRGEAWARTLDRTGWHARFERRDSMPERGQPRHPDATRGFSGVSQARGGRSLNEIAEDAITMLDSVLSSPRSSSPRLGSVPGQARGSGPGNTLVITLTRSGQLSCSADARWAARQSGSQLNQALSAALAAAVGQATRHQAPEGRRA
ncbi:MAG: hypothetical protein J2P25_16185 [Nocardiopsaceae bacterium]|nr:hypothetical protein [Nocardiopsaceae bacterium]